MAITLKKRRQPGSGGGGLIRFNSVPEALKAERVLKEAAYRVKLVAPPPALRKGCDLALEVNLVETPGMERFLKEKAVPYVDVVPAGDRVTELLDVVSVTDFGEWTMVKAGNMKLTFDKQNGMIVNTSGGGCPDIPYLHAELVGKKLAEARKPREIGFTLCALMLNRAFEECRLLWEGGKGK